MAGSAGTARRQGFANSGGQNILFIVLLYRLNNCPASVHGTNNKYIIQLTRSGVRVGSLTPSLHRSAPLHTPSNTALNTPPRSTLPSSQHIHNAPLKTVTAYSTLLLHNGLNRICRRRPKPTPRRRRRRGWQTHARPPPREGRHRGPLWPPTAKRRLLPSRIQRRLLPMVGRPHPRANRTPCPLFRSIPAETTDAYANRLRTGQHERSHGGDDGCG